MNDWQMDLVRSATDAPELLQALVQSIKPSAQQPDLRDVI
jgi:hypothetical protein